MEIISWKSINLTILGDHRKEEDHFGVTVCSYQLVSNCVHMQLNRFLSKYIHIQREQRVHFSQGKILNSVFVYLKTHYYSYKCPNIVKFT